MTFAPLRRRAVTLALVLSFAAGLLGTAAPAAFAQPRSTNASIDAVLGDHAAYEAAVRALQAAVAAHDAPAVAALVSYPIRVTIGGRKTQVRNARAFVASYDRIVTPAIAQAVTAQKYDEMMVSQQGLMFGSGEVWINGVCADKACAKSSPKVVAIQPTR